MIVLSLEINTLSLIVSTIFYVHCTVHTCNLRLISALFLSLLFFILLDFFSLSYVNKIMIIFYLASEHQMKPKQNIYFIFSSFLYFFFNVSEIRHSRYSMNRKKIKSVHSHYLCAGVWSFYSGVF